MTDKELKRIGRAELLELLLAQSEENEALQIRIEELEQELRNREIIIANAGTIADAAFQLNGVFDAAGAAAVQYLENIKRLNRQLELKAQEMGIKVEDIEVPGEKAETEHNSNSESGTDHTVISGEAASNLVRGYSLSDLERLLAQERGEDLK
jgi:hypothetical protein